MKGKLIAIFLSVASSLSIWAYVVNCAQVEGPVIIPIGSTVELSWQAPPDTDVVSYDAYFIRPVPGDTTHMGITLWSTVGDTSAVTVTQQLPLGAGFVKMTATDRSGNHSVFSADSASYIVQDIAPQPPSFIRIKVVASPQLRSSAVAKKHLKK